MPSISPVQTETVYESAAAKTQRNDETLAFAKMLAATVQNQAQSSLAAVASPAAGSGASADFAPVDSRFAQLAFLNQPINGTLPSFMANRWQSPQTTTAGAAAVSPSPNGAVNTAGAANPFTPTPKSGGIVGPGAVAQPFSTNGVSGPQKLGRPVDLSAFPRPANDNGRGIHWIPTPRQAPDVIEKYVGEAQEMGIKTHYIHSEVQAFDRIEILRDLRLGVYDVVVGINLLREGLDLPEVSLVCILDADKEGYLRSNRSLVQTIGRAARHIEGRVIMYADKVTLSMQNAIDETYRRRKIQEEYNTAHGLEPVGITKAIRDITDRVRAMAEEESGYDSKGKARTAKEMSKDELLRMVKELETQMKAAARALEFEKAAGLRDQVVELRRELVGSDDEELKLMAEAAGKGGPIRYGRSQAGGRDRRGGRTSRRK